jgi:hypothetical protein
MKLTPTEQKLILLAMDPAAPAGELASAANKFVLLLRKRFEDGHALIKDLEALPERVNRFGEYTLRFGKFAGRALKDTPADYLAWLLSRDDLWPPTRTAVEGWLNG